MSRKKIIGVLGAVVVAAGVLISGQLSELIDGLYGVTALSATAAPVEGDLSVHFIDVGQADSILILAPEKTVLIDAGDLGGGDALNDYLHAQGVEKLDLLLATHPHADHIGGMSDVVREFEVGKVLFSDVPKSLLPTTKVYETLLDTIADKGLKISKATPDTQYELGGGAVLTILGPLKQYTDDLNETSIVCRLDYGETSFLFTGDAETGSENDMLRTYERALSADVLKLGHHGSNTSSQKAWLDAVNPDIAIASVGYDNKYGHPHAEILNRLEKRGTRLYRTDESGSIVVGSDGSTLQIVTER